MAARRHPHPHRRRDAARGVDPLVRAGRGGRVRGRPRARGCCPPGARLVEVRSTYARVKGSGRQPDGRGAERPPARRPDHRRDPPPRRRPRRASSPARSCCPPRMADDFDVGVGDDLVLERPALSARVVGEVEPDGLLELLAPAVRPGRAARRTTDDEASAFVLIDLPAATPVADLVGAPAGRPRQHPGAGPPAVDRTRDDDGAEAVRWSLVIGALVLTVVGIVISAAFAVGARRQLVTLGQLSASGASPATVRTALVLQGTVTGLVGAAIGLALAGVLLLARPAAGRAAARPAASTATPSGPSRWSRSSLIGIAAATLAALIPARTAARIPTLAALAGRRPLAPVSRRLVAVGLRQHGRRALAAVHRGARQPERLVRRPVGARRHRRWRGRAPRRLRHRAGDRRPARAARPPAARLAAARRPEPGSPPGPHRRGRVGGRRRRRARRRRRRADARRRGAAAATTRGCPTTSSSCRAYDDDGRGDRLATLPDRGATRRGSDAPGALARSELRGAFTGAADHRADPAFWTVLDAGGPCRRRTASVRQPHLGPGAGGRRRPLLDALRAGDEVRDGAGRDGVVVLTSRNTGFEFDGDVTVGLPDGRAVAGRRASPTGTRPGTCRTSS